MFDLPKQGSYIIFAYPELFFLSVEPSSPSFGKSFGKSIDVRVCLLDDFVYMTQLLCNL